MPVPAPEPGPIPGISELQDRLSRRGEDLKRRAESVSSVSTDDVKEIQSELAKGFTDATNSMDALARTTSKLDGASSEVRMPPTNCWHLLNGRSTLLWQHEAAKHSMSFTMP